MKWNLSIDQTLRTMLYLAAEAKIVTSGELSDILRIPRQSIVELASRLIDARLLGAQTGANGGYFLAKGADNISMLDIILALGIPGLFPKRSETATDNISATYELAEMVSGFLLSNITLDVLGRNDQDVIRGLVKNTLNQALVFLARKEAV